MMRTVGLAIVSAMLGSATLWAAPDYIVSPTPRKVLFIGNSYTYSNNGAYYELAHLAAAAAQPDTITYSTSMIGGGTLSEHWAAAAPGKIREGGWDVVVLQEYRTLPATMDTFFHYARLFHALIDSVGAQTVFFMIQETPYIPLIYTRPAYDSIGRELGVPVVPIGLAFENVRVNRPDLDLYSPDRSHPNTLGTYLGGCMFYTAFTRKNPMGIPYIPDTSIGVDSTEEAAYVQGVAWDVLHDYIAGACTSLDTPTVPAGLAGNPLSVSTARLTWNASTHGPCGVRLYRVRRNGVAIGTAYNTVFTDQKLSGGITYGYTVAAVSWGNVESAQSAPVLVATAQDTSGPQLLEARLTRDSTSVVLVFSEQLDPVSAGNTANYTISGVTVAAATPAGSMVTLTTSPMTAFTTYTVLVTGVKDNSARQNPMVAGAQAQFIYVLPFRDEPIGYWPFDNTLEDRSADTNNGTWVGTPSYSDNGQMGPCLSLNGDSTGPYVSMRRNPVFNGMANLSISVWCKKAHADTGGQVFLKYTSYSLTLSGTILSGSFTGDTGVSIYKVIPEYINNTSWHHYAFVYDGRVFRVYVDAREVFSRPLTGVVHVDNSRDLTVGKYPWGAQRTFKGLVDDFKMYAVAMDSLTVVSIFQNNTAAQGQADSAAVRELLDRNAVGATVAQVTRRDPISGRVLGLYVDNLGFDRFTAEIGQLTAMTSLRCAGGTGVKLAIIDPAMANCTKLETLALNTNDLTALPEGIVALTSLKYLDVGHNRLCGLAAPLVTWLNTYDPDWQSTQECAAVLRPFRTAAIGPAGTKVIICDLAGKETGRGTLDAQGTVSTDAASGLASGIYLLKVEGKTTWEKVLIVR
jgi:hypothetical protein